MEVKNENLMDLEAERANTTNIGPILLNFENETVDFYCLLLNLIETGAIKRQNSIFA